MSLTITVSLQNELKNKLKESLNEFFFLEAHFRSKLGVVSERFSRIAVSVRWAGLQDR